MSPVHTDGLVSSSTPSTRADFACAAARKGRLAFLVSALTLLVFAASSRGAVVRPFEERFTANTTGEILIIGNTLETCPTTDARCADAVAGILALDNNSFNMVYVDVDADAATFNSSRAMLFLDPNAEVLFAGLYWGGELTAGLTTGAPAPDADAADRVQFLTPSLPGYLAVSAEVVDYRPDPDPDRGLDYQGFADVTSLVRAGGTGEYGVANVQAGTGRNRNAGWSLIVVVRDPAEPLRNLSVFDGFAYVTVTDPAVSITASGFLTPFSGTVQARVGLVAYEGDVGLVGDNFRLNGTLIGNALNPVDNLFNSSATAFEVRFDQKTPDYTNQLAIDFDVFRATDILPNGATSATLALATQSDAYYPGAVTFSTVLFSPVLNALKSVTDLNGGDAMPGDLLEYSIEITNDGADPAENAVLTDTLPAFTQFVPGSLEIVSGSGAGAKTDALGDDQGEISADGGTVVFRLGSGANGSAGGSLAPNDTAVVRFRVAIDADATDGLALVNRAEISAQAATLGGEVGTVSNPVTTIVVDPGPSPQADLQVVKTVEPASVEVGQSANFEIAVTNLGPDPATSVLVIDSSDFEIEAVGVQPADVCVIAGGVLLCELPRLDPSDTFNVLVEVIGREVGTFQNHAAAVSLEPDPDPSNNEDSATLLVAPGIPGPSVPSIPVAGLPGLALFALLLVLFGGYRLLHQ